MGCNIGPFGSSEDILSHCGFEHQSDDGPPNFKPLVKYEVAGAPRRPKKKAKIGNELPQSMLPGPANTALPPMEVDDSVANSEGECFLYVFRRVAHPSPSRRWSFVGFASASASPSLRFEWRFRWGLYPG